MSIFEDKKYSTIFRMRHFEKGSGKEGFPIGNHGTFFSRDLYTMGKLWTKFQLYKNFFPRNYPTRPNYELRSKFEGI